MVITFMSFSSDSEILRIYDGVLDRSLPYEQWTHAAHFAAAVCIVSERGPRAHDDMPAIIRAYNEATGTANTDTTGYHETITQASLMAAASVLLNAPTAMPLYEVVNSIMAGEFGRSDWLMAYWSKEVLFSVKARRHWVPPDVKVLPFNVLLTVPLTAPQWLKKV